MTRLFLTLLAIVLPAVATWATPADSLSTAPPQQKQERRHRPFHALYEFVKEFSRVDTNYVEPQHYNFTFMMQNTNTYEVYRLRNEEGQDVTFSPRPAYKVGPYFGWRWIFLGYTFDISHLGDNDGRSDFNLSLYSNQIGIDIFSRKSGESYRITRLKMPDVGEIKEMKNQPFDGFKSSVNGFNLYYIFNHRKFSYPAAYSQSTVQRRSAGSFLAGIGYTRHQLDVDWTKFNDLVHEVVPSNTAVCIVDSTLLQTHINYTDYSLSGGYAYNWVFAYNWLFDISLQAALAYKHSNSDNNSTNNGFLRDFDFRNLNVDGILRAGVVWNNTKWYAGTNAIFHAYNYNKSPFSTNNIFGSVNVYVGFNFNKR